MTVTKSPLFHRWREDEAVFIKLSYHPITLDEAKAAVHHLSCGAIAFFEGTIRRQNVGRDVVALEYEVYESFFYEEIRRIVGEIETQWTIHDIAFLQRLGRLRVGESGIIIAASSVHRSDALQAVDYAIHELKKRAPVWKKEFYQNGSAWVVCRHENDEVHH